VDASLCEARIRVGQERGINLGRKRALVQVIEF